MTNTNLRNQYKVIRKNIANKEIKNIAIFNKVISLKEFNKAKTIGIYINTKDEVQTTKIIERSLNLNKTVVVPKIVDNIMNFYQINNLNDLVIGTYDILEPTNNEIYQGTIDIMFVPGVVFDNSNNRMGMGKGYYDKYLASINTYKIGLAYKEQIIDKLEVMEHDVKMDLIITD